MSIHLFDDDSIGEARTLRDRAALRFCPKELNQLGKLVYLAKLLNNPNACGSYLPDGWANANGTLLQGGVTDEQLGILRALNGPHGYAIYRMLLLKKESHADENV